MAKKPTPMEATSHLLGKCNIACEIDHQHDYAEPKEMEFTAITDDGLASRRSKHEIRSHEELKAAQQGTLPAGYGMALRMRMAGVGGNDQFPWSTDEYGKQRN